MLSIGHLDRDSALVCIGPPAECHDGRRHFLELVSIFTSAPQFAALQGRQEIGTVDQFVLIRKVTGPRVISLPAAAGRYLPSIWSRRRAHVEPAKNSCRGTCRVRRSSRS
jgi:ATP-dependent Lhr-like helicase